MKGQDSPHDRNTCNFLQQKSNLVCMYYLYHYTVRDGHLPNFALFKKRRQGLRTMKDDRGYKEDL